MATRRSTRLRKRQIEKEQHTSKILVKNIPFQANKKEICELFRVFGELKFIRMPKKIDDEHHRGFAFVDFVSKNDAKVRTIKQKEKHRLDYDISLIKKK